MTDRKKMAAIVIFLVMFIHVKETKAQDTIQIPPELFIIQGKRELYLDIRFGVPGIPGESSKGVDLRGYYIEFVFSKSHNPFEIQIFLKNKNWANLYQFPVTPINGKVTFHPATDNANVRDFSDLKHINAIGCKVHRSSAHDVKRALKIVRLVKSEKHSVGNNTRWSSSKEVRKNSANKELFMSSYGKKNI